MRALAHVLLGLLRGSEGAGGGYRMNAGIEIDVALPYPGVSGRVSRNDRDVTLVTVGFVNLEYFLRISATHGPLPYSF